MRLERKLKMPSTSRPTRMRTQSPSTLRIARLCIKKKCMMMKNNGKRARRTRNKLRTRSMLAQLAAVCRTRVAHPALTSCAHRTRRTVNDTRFSTHGPQGPPPLSPSKCMKMKSTMMSTGCSMRLEDTGEDIEDRVDIREQARDEEVHEEVQPCRSPHVGRHH